MSGMVCGGLSAVAVSAALSRVNVPANARWLVALRVALAAIGLVVAALGAWKVWGGHGAAAASPTQPPVVPAPRPEDPPVGKSAPVVAATVVTTLPSKSPPHPLALAPPALSPVVQSIASEILPPLAPASAATSASAVAEPASMSLPTPKDPPKAPATSAHELRVIPVPIGAPLAPLPTPVPLTLAENFATENRPASTPSTAALPLISGPIAINVSLPPTSGTTPTIESIARPVELSTSENRLIPTASRAASSSAAPPTPVGIPSPQILASTPAPTAAPAAPSAGPVEDSKSGERAARVEVMPARPTPSTVSRSNEVQVNPSRQLAAGSQRTEDSFIEPNEKERKTIGDMLDVLANERKFWYVWLLKAENDLKRLHPLEVLACQCSTQYRHEGITFLDLFKKFWKIDPNNSMPRREYGSQFQARFPKKEPQVPQEPKISAFLEKINKSNNVELRRLLTNGKWTEVFDYLLVGNQALV